MLKKNTNPTNAPKPNQYQYESVKNPRVSKKATPKLELLLCQLFPRNSLTIKAFCPYIKGEIQKPQIHQLLISFLDRMKPPNARNVRTAKDPNVLATIMFLPSAAIARNNPEAIWLINNSTRYCLKNLPTFGSNPIT